MFRIHNLKLPLDAGQEHLRQAVLKKIQIAPKDLLSLTPVRKAIDARDRSRIRFVYTVDIDVRNSARVKPSPHVIPAPAPRPYPTETSGDIPLIHRPIIAGAGPGGLFAAFRLAKAGYAPLVLERGKPARERREDVIRFLKTGELSPESNIAFGEGGAGAFSDGKLSTGIHDPRCHEVLQTLVSAGAPKEILYTAKPHLGTDRLPGIISRLRQIIESLGGEFRFSSRLTGLRSQHNALTGIQVNGNTWRPASVLILAAGHSARDIYEMLYRQGIALERKAFSAGVRIEHPQALIDARQYGAFAGHPALGAADYKLSCHLCSGRGVYTFCMCPGGTVVPAATEPGGVVTNGMSPWKRDGANANSALLVSVAPEDLESGHPLAGMYFQRELEQRAFQSGGGGYRAPVQPLGDFLAGKTTYGTGPLKPTYLPGVTPSDLALCLPGFITNALRESIPLLDRQLPGFADPAALLTGVETRSSSPVRVLRDQDLQSSLRGLIPCGEGAGYAGGIMSAAVDGLRCADAVVRRYRPF
jgi:uncharacterized FAD-dependent dehydrogenase